MDLILKLIVVLSYLPRVISGAIVSDKVRGQGTLVPYSPPMLARLGMLDGIYNQRHLVIKLNENLDKIMRKFVMKKRNNIS